LPSGHPALDAPLTDSDGALGIKEINVRGGMVLVQEPSDAEYDGMPQSAVATGLADLVLPLREIPAALLRRTRGGSKRRMGPC
jgi:two-component system, chemotaxis family, CheB/CheR fusion protein